MKDFIFKSISVVCKANTLLVLALAIILFGVGIIDSATWIYTGIESLVAESGKFIFDGILLDASYEYSGFNALARAERQFKLFTLYGIIALFACTVITYGGFYAFFGLLNLFFGVKQPAKLIKEGLASNTAAVSLLLLAIIGGFIAFYGIITTKEVTEYYMRLNNLLKQFPDNVEARQALNTVMIKTTWSLMAYILFSLYGMITALVELTSYAPKKNSEQDQKASEANPSDSTAEDTVANDEQEQEEPDEYPAENEGDYPVARD